MKIDRKPTNATNIEGLFSDGFTQADILDTEPTPNIWTEMGYK